jgi:hypothetical protein
VKFAIKLMKKIAINFFIKKESYLASPVAIKNAFKKESKSPSNILNGSFD